MIWYGKAIGALVGLATGKWPLALAGLFLGHQFDRGFARRAGPARLPRDFVEVAFSAMGHLAKADGRVSEEEIRVARIAMHTLSLDSEQTQLAMRCFNAGKRANYPLADELARLRRQSASPAEVGRTLLQILLPIMLVEDEVSGAERRVLWEVCREFGVSRVELAQLEAINRAQRGFRRSAAGREDQTRADRAFATLGLSQDASNDDIKRAYRRMMNRNHPDKVSGGGASDGEVAEAGRRTREIREAYELLKARRGFK